MRFGFAALLAAVLVTAGCSAQAYTCGASEQCDGGECQPNGFCSFPDPACESGQRYGEFSGQGLGGQCVEPLPGSSSGVTTTSVPAPSTTEEASTTSADDTTSSSDESTTASLKGGTTTTSTPSTGSGNAESNSSGAEPVDPSLVAWWRLDEDPAGGVLDSTINGLDGVCEVCPLLGPGVVDGALAFNAEEVIFVEQSNAFISDAFTVTAWVRIGAIAAAPSFHHFVGKSVGPTNRNTFELYLANTDQPRLRFNVANATVTSGAQVAAPGLDVWTHMAGTFDGDAVRLFVDGEEAAENVAPQGGIEWDDNPVVMGGDIDSGELQTTFTGALDDVRFYDRVLEPAEIAALASLR